MSGEGDAKRADVREGGSELIGLLRRYLIQETVDPLKQAARTLLFGSAAAILLGIGAVLLLLGALRVLQTETGTVFRGSLSWLPYGITAFAGLVLVGLGGGLLLRSSGNKRAGKDRARGAKRRAKAGAAKGATTAKRSEVG
jgi:hypothetical protein